MEATKPYYSIINQIKDDKLDVDHLEDYKLTLHIGTDEFQISIFDVNNKCLILEDYKLFEVKNSEDCIEILSGIFESHHLLKAGFWKEIKVSFKNNKATLIPLNLFEDTHVGEYLQLICEIEPDSEEIHFYPHKKGSYVTVFAADKKILDWLRLNYQSAPLTTLHQSSIVIEGIIHYDGHPQTEGVFIYLHRQDLHIVATSRKQLQYYNRFNCSSPEEFIRYILLVFQELRFNPNQTQVVLWGNFDEESAYFKKIYQYVRNVSFANKPSFLKLNFQFDELFDHEYLDLYSINLC